MPAAPALPPHVVAFVESGLSITVAARGDRLVPSIAKAAAFRVQPGHASATVLLFATEAEAVCRDVAHNGHIAVCLSRPSTHETVQLKGRDARPVPIVDQDYAYARRSMDLLSQDLGKLGFTPEYVDAVFWRRPEDLMALQFTLDAAFSQTPGPTAGDHLGSTRA